MRENPDCPFGQISKLVGLGVTSLAYYMIYLNNLCIQGVTYVHAYFY